MVVFYFTASILFAPVCGLSHSMRNVQGLGSGLRLHTFRIIRPHRIDPGAMTSNYPSLPAPDEAATSAPLAW